MDSNDIHIAIIGLGYVGLPLLKRFSSKFNCVGLDSNMDRIEEIKTDPEINTQVHLTSNWSDLRNCSIYIVAVPTPIYKNYKPDISSLRDVCEHLSHKIKRGDLIIFESTVYPGTTDEICVPILEIGSGMQLNTDFSIGYSPERINVGDSIHQLGNTPKLISASNTSALETMFFIYQQIISAKIIPALSIKTAEAAKMYENVQRDLLIALANQYADYCRAEQIDIQAVTDCASSKWNFCDTRPGLVGGHCIGVDSYYLIKRATDIGANVSLIKLARSINEQRSKLITERIINFARGLSMPIDRQSILLLGFSFKADSSDIRNTKVASIIKTLKNTFLHVDCYDPLVDPPSCLHTYKIKVYNHRMHLRTNYDIVVKIVPHKIFNNFTYPTTLYICLSDLL